MASGSPDWTIRPPSMIAMWLPILSASSRSWLTNTMVLCSRALQVEQLVLEAVADQRVERRERLVHQQDVGVGGERAGEADPLLHAAGELVRELVGPGVEIDHRQLLGDDRSRSALAHAAQLQAEADVLGHGAPGQQRELLEHHGDPLGAQAAERAPDRSGRRRPAALGVGDQDLGHGSPC